MGAGLALDVDVVVVVVVVMVECCRMVVVVGVVAGVV